jgi:subtilisin family serine protease
MLITGFIQKNKSKYYYAYNEKVYIEESENKLIIRYKNNKEKDKEKISSSSEFKGKVIKWKDDSTYVITLSNKSEKILFKNRLENRSDIKFCNEIYSIYSGLELGITNEFLVKFNEGVSKTEIKELHEKYNVKIIKSTKIYQLLKVDLISNVLEVANAYQESGLTRFSQPNFISDIDLHQTLPNDTYFTNQFSLHNTGQVFADGHSGTTDADIDAPEAWSITTGNSGIVIAVLDQGVTSNHPDLPNTRQIRLNGSNFADGDPNDPSPTGNGNHGNGCSGIIAATQNNNQGITGIAPNCSIMPIRIFNANGTGITPQALADAIVFAVDNGADVISNSWGYNSTNPNLHPVIRDAIIYATTQGRSNLGCIVVFSAGNTANHVIGNNGGVNFPSNVNINGVLTVGASDRFDLQANYSPSENISSSNNQIIDLVAPSHRAYSCQIATETFEAYTIDIPGNAGYNPVNNNDCGSLPVISSVLPNTGTNNLSYTGRFGGTSYSCPQVAGVSALILSINYNLTQQEVFNIITSTADKVGGYTYNSLGKSNELGNGRLNAHQAVQAAMPQPIINGSSLVCNAPNQTYTLTNATGSVTWQVSSKLQIVSSSNTQVTVKATNSSVSGSGFVKAITATATTQKDVWVGKPKLTSASINGIANVNCNSIYIYEYTGGILGAESTRWEVSLQFDDVSSVNNKTLFADPTNKGSGYVTFVASNACGEAIFCKPVDVDGFSCGADSINFPNAYSCGGGGSGPFSFRVSPNPSNSVINIALKNADDEASKQINDITELRLYDFKGNILIQKKNSDLKSINVSRMKEGMYYLEIISSDTKEIHRIVVDK